MMTFANRADAGRRLASQLSAFRNRDDLLILGLPRGGVPVAAAVARALNASLDVMIVRKIGTPRLPELAVGAVASGGVIVLNDEFDDAFTDPVQLRKFAARELIEVAHCERRFRGNRPPLRTRNRCVILVDDGAATGASMIAAIRAVRELGARRVVVAIPVASYAAHRKLEAEADEVVCLLTPNDFHCVGDWYRDFAQTSDAEVSALLSHSSLAHVAG